MLAYHNDESLKQSVLKEMHEHKEADRLVKGQYWEDGKGCAVGCLIKCNDHSLYEEEFGIPQMLAMLEDSIFEGLPNDKAQEWPERFLSAINTGADLSLIGWEFLYWNLTENLALQDSDDKDIQKIITQCRDAIKQCADVIYPLTKGENIDQAAVEAAAAIWPAVWPAAWAAEASVKVAAATEAAEAARSAAKVAAWSAEAAAAVARSTEAAEAAARSTEAAEAAAEAAEAVEAAWSAAEAAEAAEAARSAAKVAWPAAWERLADKLIELLGKAPIEELK